MGNTPPATGKHGNLKMHLLPVTLDDKYTASSGRVFLSGLQALTRLLLIQSERDRAAGLNTAGFVSGYQGSPLNNMDKTLWTAAEHLKRHHVHFQPGHNEELALTAVWGSQQVNLLQGARHDGVFSLWYGKWAGVGRCGDTFNHGNSAGAARYGGVLVVCGDDHAARSSTIATQSEYMLIAPMIPVLAPASVQDYLDLGVHGWAMSRFSGSWIGFKAVDETVESSASINVERDRISAVIPDDFVMPPGGLNIRVPDQPLEMERRIHEYRLPAVQAYARANALDRIVLSSSRPRFGIVAAGKSYLDVRQALDHLGIGERECETIGLSVYKVAMTWPLEPRGLQSFAKGLEEVLVVEEKRPLLEDQIKEQLYDLPSAIRPRILGKRGEAAGAWLLPPLGELTPELVALAIAQRVGRFYTSERLRQGVAFLKNKQDALTKPSLSPQLRGYLSDSGRIPYYCSGCPHNTSTRVPEGSHAIAGVGCHFMASYIFPGTEIFSHMGAEGAVWIGQAPFTSLPHMFANVGDGTYYHSGILAIRAALSANVPITFKILYNDATAATGGQPLPSPMTVPRVTRQLEAEGVKRIVVVTDDTAKYGADAGFAPGVRLESRERLDRVQKSLREFKGVSVIVYDQTCAAEKRRRRKRNAFPDPARRSFINTRVCEGCGDCNVKSNCVSILPHETEFGRKRIIDQSSCNKDFSCIQGFCPSYVTVEGGTLKRGRAVTAVAAAHSFAALREPGPHTLDRPYGIVVTGIGGTGVITIGALLGMAAHLEGKAVSVLDMTGVAQKGGAVHTFVRIAARPEHLSSIRIAAGDADAVIGCDLLVTCENEILIRMRPGTTRAVINSNRLPTVAFIRNPDLKTPWGEMEEGLRAVIGHEAAKFIDATSLVTSLMGDAIAVNVFMLGFAYQSGHVPLSSAALQRAIELNGVAVEKNQQAFQWGRLAACDPIAIERLLNPTLNNPVGEIVASDLDEIIKRRVTFLTQYQNANYAQQYLDLVKSVRSAEGAIRPARFHSGEMPTLTEVVARSYFKLMSYKDEYEVARLYTDGEFERRVADTFEGAYKIRYHFAPPLLPAAARAGEEPAKRSFGPWIRPALVLLARMKGLRGTLFDPFGHTPERRAERRSITEYRATIENLLPRLRPETLDLATEIARLPDTIRGFGHIKKSNNEAANKRQAELLNEFCGDARPRAAS